MGEWTESHNSLVKLWFLFNREIMVIPRHLYNNCEYSWNNPIIKYLLHVQDTTIINVYFAGLLSTSFTLHTTVSFHFLSSCSSGVWGIVAGTSSSRRSVVSCWASLHRSTSILCAGSRVRTVREIIVNRTPRGPGLWLWCFSLCNLPNDIIWALGCRKRFLVELHVFVELLVVLLVADPE